MGQKQSSGEDAHAKNMEELKSNTAFTSQEIKNYYERFQDNFPDGQITKHDFVEMYAEMNPSGDSQRFAEYVFKAHDVDRNGTVDFKEFMTALSVSVHGSIEERLHWAFNMYDTNGNGYLSRREATEIILAIFRMRGNSDRHSAEDAALKVFIALDKDQDDRLTRAEFISGCKNCGSLISLIDEKQD